jgi:hypothetical protein
MEKWENGIEKGKQYCIWNDGDKYEGDIKNDIIEEKRIFY